MEQNTSCEVNTHSSSQEIPGVLWTRSFIIVFIRSHYWSLSWPRHIQSTVFHLIYVQYIVILNSNLRLSLRSGFFLQVFRPKLSMHFSFPSCTWKH